MLSIEACRKLLDKGEKELTDDEIREIEEFLYSLATILVRNLKGE